MSLAGDEGFVAGVADILSNFAVVINIVIAFFVSVMIYQYGQEDDSKWNEMVDLLVEKHGVVETGNKIKFKKGLFFFVTIPFWCILIAAGWFVSAFIWMFLSAALNIQLAAQRRYFKESYLDKVEGNKDETDTDSSTDDLSRNSLL